MTRHGLNPTDPAISGQPQVDKPSSAGRDPLHGISVVMGDLKAE
jgi:hypothetical protein